MKAADDRRNTLQMEPNPLALRRADNGNGNGTANPDEHSTDGRTVVTSTTVNASFNAQSPDVAIPTLTLTSVGSTAEMTVAVAERGDVVYISNDASGELATSNSSRQQQPAVVYSVPYTNRNAGTGSSTADDADGDVVDDFVPDGGSIGNPIVYATYDGGAGAGAGAATTDARYAGYEPPGVALPPPATGAVYVGGNAAPHVPGGAAAPEIVYAVPLEDGRLVVPRVPNVMYQSAGNGGGGGYYDADPDPGD